MVKHSSFGSRLYWDPYGGSDFTAIGQVGDIDGPSVSRGDVDVTDHDDAVVNDGDGWRTFLKGIPDAGDLSFVLNFDPIFVATHGQEEGTGVLWDFENTRGELPTWRLDLHTLEGTLEWGFSGYVSGATFSSPVEGAHTGDITVKISGKPTLTAEE